MPYTLFWDIETQEKIDDKKGRFREDRIRKLNVSCACTLRVDSDLIMDGREEDALLRATQTTYWVDDIDGLQPMLSEFDGAELLVSYNGFSFDHLVLQKYYRGDRRRELSHTFKAHDVFKRIVDSQASRWPSLDKLLSLNGFDTKGANGLIAIKWWASGNRRDLEEYCRSDVMLMAKLALSKSGIILDGSEPMHAPHAVVGVAPSLAARRFRFPDRRKRGREGLIE